MEINYNENPELWDEFIATSPQRSIFVSTKFLDSLNTKYEIISCSENGRIVAGTVVLFERDRPIDRVFSFTQYQGVLFAGNPQLKNHSKISSEFKILEFFISELVNHYKRVCLCQSWRLTDLRPFQWFNYHEPEKGVFNLTLRYSAVLPLSGYKDFEDYKANVRKVRRQELNKATQNLEIEVIEDEEILDDLHEKTFQRQGIKRDSKESDLLKSITKSALENKYGRLTCVRKDGIPIAANLFIFDDRTGYYLFGANHPDYRNTFASTLLLGDAIKDCMDKGLQEVDFVGANSPNRGDFKLSFNPGLEPYFVTSFLKDKTK